MKLLGRFIFLLLVTIHISCQNNDEANSQKKHKKSIHEKELKQLTEEEQLLQNIMYAHQVEKFKQKNKLEFSLHLTEEIESAIKAEVNSQNFEFKFQKDSINEETKLFAQLFTFPYRLNHDDFKIQLIEEKEDDGVKYDVFKVTTQEDMPYDIEEIQTQSNTHLIKSISLRNEGQSKRFIYQKYISVSGISIPIQIDYYQKDKLIQRLSIQRISFK